MTEEFSPDWLALREPYDTRARSEPLARVFLESLPACPCILDLGAGRGANARYLEGISASEIAWRLVDHNPELLARADGIRGETSHQIVDFAPNPGLIDKSGLNAISASALFDLVSEGWFSAFIKAVAGLPLLFALTANGDHAWQPSDPADKAVMDEFEADTRRDKGFGPAMGPDGPARMVDLLSAAGYQVLQESSPWWLGSADGDLLTSIVDLIADVASQRGEAQISAGWRERRQNLIEVGALRLDVGHVDIVALPPNGTQVPRNQFS
jgi:hypothetical protein